MKKYKFQNNKCTLKAQSRNLGTFFLIQTLTPFLKAPILFMFLRDKGNPFQSKAPLNFNEFFNKESFVLLTILETMNMMTMTMTLMIMNMKMGMENCDLS